MHYQRQAFLLVAGNKWTNNQCTKDRDIEARVSVIGSLQSP